jgi:hypothetical protein
MEHSRILQGDSEGEEEAEKGKGGVFGGTVKMTEEGGKKL